MNRQIGEGRKVKDKIDVVPSESMGDSLHLPKSLRRASRDDGARVPLGFRTESPQRAVPLDPVKRELGSKTERLRAWLGGFRFP